MLSGTRHRIVLLFLMVTPSGMAIGQDTAGAWRSIPLIQDGKVQSVCIADPRDWEAWASVDTANRLMQGQPAAEQRIPVRLFDASNLSELTPTDLKQGWQGGIDYQVHFLKIWGVQ